MEKGELAIQFRTLFFSFFKMRARLPGEWKWVEGSRQPIVLQGDISDFYVYVVTDFIVRVRHVLRHPNSPTGMEFPPSSCSTLVISSPASESSTSASSIIRIQTERLFICLSFGSKSLSLSWSSNDGKSFFAQDLPFRSYEVDLDGGCHHHYVMKGECEGEGGGNVFYGMGERASPLSLNNRHLRLECCDSMGYNAEHSDPLYKHFPYYLSLHRQTREAYGIFYHDYCQGSMDFGKEIDALWGRY